MELFERYGPQYELLKDLFPRTNFSCERLNQIFVCTEALWDKNLHRLKGKEVKYLLIAEAPPWTPENMEIKYFYNKNNTVRQNLRGTLWKTFYDLPTPTEPGEIFEAFAEKGFILMDTLPFAVEYKTIRASPRYGDLIQQCSPFLYDKINNSCINWSNKPKVALAFRLNGRAIISAYSGEICLKTHKVELNEDIIAAGGANYPTATNLRRIFCL